jgi:predicted metal-dependent peptidase
MRIQDALIKLLIWQPFYGSLASVLSLQESKSIKNLKLSLLPSPVLKYNQDWFVKLSDDQATGALMHELLHLLLLHSLRRGNRDLLLWAVCCDMAGNDHIPIEMLPESAVTTRQIELKLRIKLERRKSAEYYYDKLYALLDDSISLVQRDDSVIFPGNNGSLLEADIEEEEDVNHVNEAALKTKLQETMQMANENGELPPELQTEFTLTPKRSKIDWRNIFRRFLSGMGRMQIRATYKRESRRFDGFPGHKRSIGMKVLIALDESGSISDEHLDVFFNELMSINRIKGVQLLVTVFDSVCSEPKPAEAYRHMRNRTKNGGTDFKPIFKLAEKLNIFSVVIFTDGNGDAPIEVNQRVLWILTHNGRKPAPYGYSVKFEE